MTQTQDQNAENGLNRIRRWRDQYRGMLAPSPLEAGTALVSGYG